MKKIVVIILTLMLAISMLTACGSNSTDVPNTSYVSESKPTDHNDTQSKTGNDTSASTEFNPIVVKPSELIFQEDAARILGGEVTVDDVDDVEPLSLGSMKTSFDSTEHRMYYLCIWINQTSMLDPEMINHKVQLERGGIATHNDDFYETTINLEDAMELDNLGDWAIIRKDNIYVAYGDYFIDITINTAASKVKLTEEEYKEKLTEAGTLAFTRLKAIVDA